MLLRALDAAQVLVALGKAAQLAARAARRAAASGCARVEEPRGLAGVADEDLRDPARVVEADEELGHDEAALVEARARRPGSGTVGSRRVTHVVAEVADDRRAERLRLVEADDARAAADERVPPEPAALDRLEQERAGRAVAHAEVGPERGQQVGCDFRVHGSKKAPLGADVERNGVARA